MRNVYTLPKQRYNAKQINHVIVQNKIIVFINNATSTTANTTITNPINDSNIKTGNISYINMFHNNVYELANYIAYFNLTYRISLLKQYINKG